MFNGAKFLTVALSLVMVGASTWAGEDRWRFIMTCDSRGTSVTGVNEIGLVYLPLVLRNN